MHVSLQNSGFDTSCGCATVLHIFGTARKPKIRVLFLEIEFKLKIKINTIGHVAAFQLLLVSFNHNHNLSTINQVLIVPNFDKTVTVDVADQKVWKALTNDVFPLFGGLSV